MKNLVIIFGGTSVEHDISILTALHAAHNVVGGARVHFVYITKKGRMVVGRSLADIDYFISGAKGRVRECRFENGTLYVKGRLGQRRLCRVDVVLNCCHGGPGENGQLAALLDMADVPMVGCDTHSASVLMSKITTREKLVFHGFAQPKFIQCSRKHYLKNPEACVESICSTIPFPLIIKPNTLGSSIGIAIAKTREELAQALELAFSFDSKVIVEDYLDVFFEVNCSAFLHNDKIWVSKCEDISSSSMPDTTPDVVAKDKVTCEIIADLTAKYKNEFLKFEDKYLRSARPVLKKSLGEGNEVVEPYKQRIFEQIQDLMHKAYELFGCSGVVRGDFLVVKKDNSEGAEYEIYLNEINTVPGFLAYHLWIKSGVPYGVLIDMLVKQAIAQHKDKAQEITYFPSTVLEQNRSLAER